MRLTKKDAGKIARDYNLGKVKQLKYIPWGYVNYNFLLETNLGKFIIHVLGDKENYTWKLKRMKMQFKVLDFLLKRKFPYEIPFPIKNRKGDYIMDFKGGKIWVYNYIEGSYVGTVTKPQFKEFAKAMAIYHKIITP